MDIYMYWLSTLYILGSRKQNLLLSHFGDASKIYKATPESLRSLPTITENNVHTIQKSRNQSKIEYGIEMLKKLDISFTHINHPDYPKLLKTINDPPVGLFHLGKLPQSDLPHVAIIGSRNCSEYGLSTARRFGTALARAGVIIVSGMARGIDSMAHRGALEIETNPCSTIAVLGCGVDVCYPAENRSLRDEIAKTGCVVSEYPPGVEPYPAYFPARNRIISGLSRVVVVVEAGKKSGTLITVDQALDQGREVMAVPGNITNKYSDGTNHLIKQGAEPACCYEDILHMLGISKNKKKQNQNNKTKTETKIAENTTHIPLAPEEKLVYDVLGSGNNTPFSIDEIMIKTNSKLQTIQYLLTILEIKGYVKKIPGMKYVRKED